MSTAIIETTDTTSFIRFVEDGKLDVIKLKPSWQLGQMVRSEIHNVEISVKKSVYNGRVAGWYPVLKCGNKILWIGERQMWRDNGPNSAKQHAKDYYWKLMKQSY